MKKYFKSFNYILNLKNIPFLFYILIEKILKNILIEESNYIFLLLNNLTKLFISKLNSFKNRDELLEYSKYIFNIFICFLEGKII